MLRACDGFKTEDDSYNDGEGLLKATRDSPEKRQHEITLQHYT